MDRKSVLKSLQINFTTAVFAAIIAIAAFETGYITKGMMRVAFNDNDLYYIEMGAVLLTMALLPIALKSFSRAMKRAGSANGQELLKRYYKSSLLRIFLLFIPLVANIFVYYGTEYDGALYCGIVSLGALIYSYPGGRVLDEIEKNGTKGEEV